MAVIVFHAGMGKAGSSSIQQWLRTNSPTLREKGFTVLAACENDAGEMRFTPCDPQPPTSAGLWAKALVEAAVSPEAVDSFVEDLEAAADRHGNVIVSSEFYERFFFDLHHDLLSGLQRLTSRHEVKVAYYVRPQHTALEAGWRQVGVRTGLSPSAFIERRAHRLHYAATRRGVRELVPGCNFEPRPFRGDLLDGGHVVADFAQRFLGIEDAEEVWVNRGLPLEAVNVLRSAPPGAFWDRSYGNRRLRRIKRLLEGHEMPEDDRIALSRKVLRKYAAERFAGENAELGWDDFVVGPEDADAVPGLEALDELWKPQASPAELSLLFTALQAAIGTEK